MESEKDILHFKNWIMQKFLNSVHASVKTHTNQLMQSLP